MDVVGSQIPPGATIAASYHTHVNNSFFTVLQRENFSATDISTSNAKGWDAYLGTGISGHLKHYSVKDKTTRDLGRLDLE
jgi:hypothetical protein